MPRGRYLVDGRVEAFACAAGPAGWRYTSTGVDGAGAVGAGAVVTAVDLTLDSVGRQVRVELRHGPWLLRGGLEGTTLRWVRDGVEHSAAAAGFAANSPGFLVAIARLLRITPGQARRTRLVEVTGPALATRTVDVEWRCREVTTYDTDLGPLTVTRYDVVPLDTGQRRAVHLAGDVVVAADGVELVELDSPPGP
ncbi:MAG TPA: hypothetical protein VLJ59_09410 [Mycobacteriales bacterium]|nr:hypothetical protein [Mycobacteriales bacterium]